MKWCFFSGRMGTLSSYFIAYQLELIVSASISLLTVGTLRLRDWDSARSPPVLRVAVAVFLAVLGGILALRYLNGAMCGLALTLLATIALTVFLLERRPLFSLAFFSAFLEALLVCLLIWGLVVFVGYFSGDTGLSL